MVAGEEQHVARPTRAASSRERIRLTHTRRKHSRVHVRARTSARVQERTRVDFSAFTPPRPAH